MNPPIPISSLKGYEGVPAFIIGNGISRNSQDVTQLAGRGLVLGCNKFVEQEEYQKAFSGYPCWVGMVDTSMFSRVNRFKLWEHFPILTKESTPNISSRPVPLLSMTLKKFFSTGHAMIEAALILKCYPIILVGCGSKMEAVREVKSIKYVTDNMYTESTGVFADAKHVRMYNKKTPGEPNGWYLQWRSELNRLTRRNPDQIYVVGDNTIYSETPWLEWADVLCAYPKQYTAHIDESGLPIRIKVRKPSVASA